MDVANNAICSTVVVSFWVVFVPIFVIMILISCWVETKVVVKEVEVPKEIETLRKEIVYVPLPTDDEELLKKGPFNAIDYDKDKKK